MTEAFEDTTSGYYPDSDSYYDDYSALGGHAVVAVGYDSDGLIVENSWGHPGDKTASSTSAGIGLRRLPRLRPPQFDQAIAMVGMSHVAAAVMRPVDGADTSWHLPGHLDLHSDQGRE